jgi:hypothetical protein
MRQHIPQLSDLTHFPDRDSRRYCGRAAFRVDSRLDRSVGLNVHCDLADPLEMERLAGKCAASLGPASERKPPNLR